MKERKKRGNYSKTEDKRNKIEALDNLIQELKKSGQPIHVTDLAEAINVGRIAMYQEHYKNILIKHGIIGEDKKKKKASPEYLLRRIEDKDLEIIRLNKIIEKLKLEIHDLNFYNQEIQDEKNTLSRLLNSFREKFYDQLVFYNNANNFKIPIEPFDILKFANNENGMESKSKVINIDKKED